MGRVTFSVPNSSRSSSDCNDESLQHLLNSQRAHSHSERYQSSRPRALRWERVTAVVLLLAVLGASVCLIGLFATSAYLQPPVDVRVLVNGSITTLKSSQITESLPALLLQSNDTATWTVFNPTHLAYPRPPWEITRVCRKAEEMAEYVKKSSQDSVHSGHYDYYHIDNSFLDPVVDLSSRPGGASVGDLCNSTLTYVLESTDPGLGKTLMGLWLSYGLAQVEGRSFFVDDRNWAYGRYSMFFQDFPKPTCKPPPDEVKVPLPHHARHLLVSSATTQSTFGHSFHEEYDNASAMGVDRLAPIFKMLRHGFEAMFHLVDEFPASVGKQMRSYETRDRDPKPLIGIHVRHGDRHPYQFKYRESYVSPVRYASAVRNVISSHHNRTGVDTLPSKIFLASDDDAVFPSIESTALSGRSSELFVPAEEAMEIYIGPDYQEAESPVFAGGFSNQAFWNMESANRLGPSGDVRDGRHPAPCPKTLRSRRLLVRSYLSDLVLLSGADDVVCTVSSTTCRVLAVMMGWDKAITRGRWHNVDGDFDWKSIVW